MGKKAVKGSHPLFLMVNGKTIRCEWATKPHDKRVCKIHLYVVEEIKSHGKNHRA